MAQKVGRIDRVDLMIRNNATLKLRLTYTDPVTGDALNLTGWDADIQFRSGPGGTLLATFGVGSGITIDAVNGIIDLKIQPSTIQAWTFNSGWYDVVVTEPNNDKDCWLEGAFEVIKGVTV